MLYFLMGCSKTLNQSCGYVYKYIENKVAYHAVQEAKS